MVTERSVEVTLYSSDEFFEAYWTAFGDGSGQRAGVFEIEGRTFKLLSRNGKPITRPKFIDFMEPVSSPPDAVDGRLGYLPRVALEHVPAPDGCPPLRGLAVAPYVKWERFENTDQFEAHVSSRNRKLAVDTLRQLRRVERELGGIGFGFSRRPGPETRRCVEWKVAQHPSTIGLLNDDRQRRFLDALFDVGLARVDWLSAGDTLLAAHIGLRHEGRFAYWIPSYDPAYGRYSPGRLLLTRLLSESFESGDREFDMLIGNEPYKWDFATDARVIGPLGRQPLLEAGVAAARSRLRLGRKLKAVKRKLRGR